MIKGKAGGERLLNGKRNWVIYNQGSPHTPPISFLISSDLRVERAEEMLSRCPNGALLYLRNRVSQFCIGGPAFRRHCRSVFQNLIDREIEKRQDE